MQKLKSRQRLGKYKIEKRLAEGGFAVVYRAIDTIEGVHVALKIPHARFATKSALADLRREVQLTAKLDHPNILPIKNASHIGRSFVIATPLGEHTLAQRMQRRMSAKNAIALTDQMIDALACAHEQNVLHRDIKPDNFIMFSGNRVRLSDFGVAKIAQRSKSLESVAGTVGYMAPEQALGHPSLRSDVFSLGLVIYKMFTGTLLEWPFAWPPEGIDSPRLDLHPELVTFLERALQVDERKRFADGGAMLSAFKRVRKQLLGHATRKRKRLAKGPRTPAWRTLQMREFKRDYGKLLGLTVQCKRCKGLMSEAMIACPFCGHDATTFGGDTTFPKQCDRCHRGLKHDFKYCPWCYGASCGPDDNRRYSDARYTARCHSTACSRKELMPFMRYCPWCRAKVRRKWSIGNESKKCTGCGWGVLRDYWDYCPWCAKAQLSRGGKTPSTRT